MCVQIILWLRRTLRTLSSKLESRKFNSRKIRQRSVHVGCIVSYALVGRRYIISLGVGFLRCLSCEKAMREPEFRISD